MEKQFARLQETQYSKTLPNGLRIFYYPKKGFSKTFAMLATNFGSVDESFTLEGIRYDTPTGVAHFLEHKMFEDEDGNALQKFAATGASPNAFTSHCMTAYHFSCTERFSENLEILLKFVYTPYFTDENVEKEKGIIGQEIGMMDDTPGWMAMIGLYEGLYHEHPVRRSIAGSVQSIAKITPDILYRCHKAFYSPSNMALVVVGNADFEEICRMAAAFSPKESLQIGQRHYGKRQNTVYQAEVVRKMAVSLPNFMVGCKDSRLKPEESYMRRTMIGDIAVRMVCGNTSPLYAKLYEQQLITPSFDTEYTILPDCAGPVFSGESPNPYAVRDAIQAELERIAREGIDKALFARIWKTAYGMNIRSLDFLEGYARLQAEACFSGEEFLSFPEIFDSITPEEVQAMISRWAQPNHMTLSIIAPEDAKEQA